MESFLNKTSPIASKVQPADTANDTSTILDVITVQVSPKYRHNFLNPCRYGFYWIYEISYLFDLSEYLNASA